MTGEAGCLFVTGSRRSLSQGEGGVCGQSPPERRRSHPLVCRSVLTQTHFPQTLTGRRNGGLWETVLLYAGVSAPPKDRYK